MGRLLTAGADMHLTPLLAADAAPDSPEGPLGLLVALVTLTAMEIVLGIDNIIFLAIIAGRLPPAQQGKARTLGLIAALGTRLLLLLTINLILRATQPLFWLPDWLFHDPEARGISVRDLILLAGGLFLIGKSTFEIHHKLEGDEPEAHAASGAGGRFRVVLVQIALLDIVFSLDSVITAVGMVRNVWVIVAGMVITVGVMLAFAGPVSRFVMKHPTLKILALAFLILIGVMLVMEGLGQHVNKGYIYFAMAFSFAVEMLNLRLRKRQDAVKLREPELPAK
jgi:predicted tellurium resistance membrane protein TerC